METDTKVKVMKMLVRMGTFVSAATTTALIIDKILPEDSLTKTGKFVVGVGGLGLCYAIGYKASLFADDLMDGRVLSDLIYGKGAWEE